MRRRIAFWLFVTSVIADALTTTVGIIFGNAAEGNRITGSFSLLSIVLISSAAKCFVLLWSRLMQLWGAWLYATTLTLLGSMYWAVSIHNLRVGG